MPKRPSDPLRRRLLKLDEEFREFVKRQPSCISGRFSEFHDGGGFSIACHVRRSATAGIGWKPLFSCVPLVDTEHKNTHQHDDGYYHPKEWWDEKASQYLERWLLTITPNEAAMVREELENIPSGTH